MNTPTYQEQWNKLTEAYIKNEVDPHNNCACFVGNLLNGNETWASCRNIEINQTGEDHVATVSILDAAWMQRVLVMQGFPFYTPNDIRDLEHTFLNTYYQAGGTGDDTNDEDAYGIYDEEIGDYVDTPINEEALFIAFEKTLDLLKRIHLKNGEAIDNEKPFVKRKLTPHATT